MAKQEYRSLFINLRFVLCFILSVALLFADLRLKVLSDFRYYIESALYPVMLFADSPRSISNAVSTQLKSRAELIAENERLANAIFEQRADLLRLHALVQENAEMRKLLNSPLHRTSRRMLAEVVAIDNDPYLQRVVVNRGSSSAVHTSMPVITSEGLVGQVIEVNYSFSRVLLLTDPSSSVPVVNVRNQLRALAEGNGSHDELDIANIARSADVQEGDLLVTSGLGGVYPLGYPVAVVTSVGISENQSFAEVKAKPLVDFGRLHYVLLYWYDASSKEAEDAVQPKEPTDGKVLLRQERIKRLIQSMSNNDKQNAPAKEAPAVKPQAKLNAKTSALLSMHSDAATLAGAAVNAQQVLGAQHGRRQ
ncbi:MAG: rod shape-determining protein MreC [Candidatus Anaerobiospirillum merdipullorum]|uniref:Cell shape-determining protein MreC n=1 Tax=Candidatus Anaerobiospirillum merdipullorum TaxID=2838450 RepID=A0A9E2KPS3_9GAMM|nr:rod shape-determining protein MreC [Candidatus Anaerobiospirillum merdipullorum]